MHFQHFTSARAIALTAFATLALLSVSQIAAGGLLGDRVPIPDVQRSAAAETRTERHLLGPPLKESVSPRLESVLGAFEDAFEERDGDVMALIAASAGIELDGDRLAVTVRPTWGRTTQAVDLGQIEKMGGEVLACSEHFLDLSIPVSKLRELSECGGVAFVQRRLLGVLQVEHRAQPVELSGFGRDPVVSEGVALSGAATQHGLGFSGVGMKVAVIDGGFIGIYDAYAAGELGGDAWFLDLTGLGIDTETEHGTAVAENVCDMAPGVTLYMIKIASAAHLESAKDFCISEGIHIINHSMGWFGQPGDGSGSICDIAEDAYANGILWVNSAGNNALNHNEGVFTDTDVDGFHEFSPGDPLLTVFLGLGESISLFLTWHAWPLTFEDYDLYLYDNSITSVAWSLNVQAPGQPVESLTYTATASGFYHVGIHDFSTTSPHEYDLMAMSGRKFHPLYGGEYYVKSGSILSPADAEHVLAVGALHHSEWYTGPVACFSSWGPTNDGRLKPEIAGPDSCASFTYDPNWIGTSSSSPHVAGAAALIWQEVPTIVTVDDIWGWLTDHAVDMGVPGQDNTYGYGRLDIPPDVPVEASFYALATEDGSVMLRWVIASTSDIQALNVYRSIGSDGTFVRINDDLMEPDSPGAFEDSTVWPGGTFCYELRALMTDGSEDTVGESVTVRVPGALGLSLRPPTPNPTADRTDLSFDIPAVAGAVKLAVFDVGGRLVRTLIDEAMPPGRYSLAWDAEDDQGSRVASGVYFCVLTAGEETRSRKVLLLR
jgi:subtilisin family serine protease